ncbi:deoxyribose-phosphate aldolase [Echinicola pacifica]|uniref:Deoxyribose-phosphate aldolase n=1 Tax=Echinicola pacifica TaxID=346377 RepID=A0A918UUV0_9BACT|nr:deoxyribose-phosphate aldolase [Echinicola pacifica]GGZ34827.1 deoxyribose-phosphate aldolase [Echinicola pacifica]
MKINEYLEHTMLKADLTDQDISKLVEEARKYQFVGVCVPPFWVKRVKRDLEDLPVQVVTVIGFPLGYQMTETKMAEAKIAIRDGADELDLVWSITAFKSGMNWPKIEMAKMAELCHESGKVLKVIVETAYLDTDELRQACKMATDAGVDYVKTSTGMASSGARLEDIRLMREILPAGVGIKASGGISTLQQAQDFIAAGADRIGTSKGHMIMEEIRK